MEAIVIKTQPYSESDLILRILTIDEGKVPCFAPAARKSRRRFSSAPDLFDRGEFELRAGRGSLATVISFHSHPTFLGLRNDLNKLTLAATTCEVFDLIIPEHVKEGSAAFFNLLKDALSEIDHSSDLKDLLRHSFLAVGKLLILSGFADQEDIQHPSANRLSALLERVEEIAGKQLMTRAGFNTVLSELKKK